MPELPPMKPATLRVWLWLEPRLKAGGQSYTQSQISEGAGVAERSVRRSVNDLRAQRRITVRRTWGVASVYRLANRPS